MSANPAGAAVVLAPAVLAAALLAAGTPPGPAPDGEPRLTVEFTPASPTVGDRVTAEIIVSAGAGRLAGDPRFPEWEESWGAAEIFEAGMPEMLGEEAGIARFRQRLTLTVFRPGRVELPPAVVSLPLTAGDAELTTPEGLAFSVVSVLPTLEEGAPAPALERRPEAAPRELPLGARFWGTAAVFSAACLLAAAVLWRQRRRLPAGGRAVPAPLEELERELDRLVPGAGPEGFADLSRALRRYLGRRLAFPALESSTPEVRRHLGRRGLDEGLSQGATTVLGRCDLVKFARAEAAAGELARQGAAARRIGRRIDRALAAPAPGSEPHLPAAAPPKGGGA